jgi:hypothetical protein
LVNAAMDISTPLLPHSILTDASTAAGCWRSWPRDNPRGACHWSRSNANHACIRLNLSPDHEAVIRFCGQGSEAAGPFSQRHCSHSRMRIAATSDHHRLVCWPTPVSRLPGSESGACVVDPHSPWSLPFAPPTPQRITPLCSPASQLLWQGQTSRARASSASVPHLPDAGRDGSAVPVRHETSQLPMRSLRT